MELRHFISKLNLESRSLLMLFLSGILTKLLISVNFSSVYSNEYFIPFIDYFYSSGFKNPYSEFHSNSIEVFPYPALMLFILTIPKIILGWIGSSLWMSLLVTKLPLLVADIIIFYVLKSWLNHKNLLKLIILYWFSPALIYISYIHGQLDSIPIALLFISLFYLFRNNLNISAIFLALALATKTVIAVVVPILIIFLISQRLSIVKILKFLLISSFAFVIVNIPFLSSASFLSMVFDNQKQGEIFQTAINFGQVSLYILPIAYCGILLKGLSFKTLSKDIFVMFLGFCFAMLLIFTDPSQGWYFWLLPFLIYFYVKTSRGTLLILLLQLAFISYFLLNDNVDFFLQDSQPLIYLQNSFQTIIFNDFSLNQVLVTNLSFTFLQGLLIFNCYWIYTYGLNKYSLHKITSIPMLIGIGGDSGSGKTTLSNALVKIFTKNKSTQLHGDDSHKWERGSQNWSKHTHLDPKANRLHQEPQILKDLLDGKTIFRQKYNHDSGKFDQPKSLSAANFLIYEGLHPFFLKRQRDLFDLKIFLNPSKEINMLWKVNRDIKTRGKTREDVIEQINLRANDSESYIKSQIRYADIIIEPVEIKDAKRVGYNILFPNSFPIDEIIEKLSNEKNLRLEHNFLDEGNQSVTIIGEIQSEKLEYLAYEFIEGIQELGISNPIWPNNEFGVLVFLVTYIIFEESEYGKN